MFQLKPLAVKDKRVCELHVMNSANGLYVALRVPNSASHKSLNPLEIDLASLAFCLGKDVARGDDRKVVAPGVYVDKYVAEPGKDEDDPKQDGRGASIGPPVNRQTCSAACGLTPRPRVKTPVCLPSYTVNCRRSDRCYPRKS